MDKRLKSISIFNVLNILLMLAVCFVTLYPIWYTVIYSFNNGNDSAINGVFYWLPRVFTIDNYKVALVDNTILRAFYISIMRTIIATFVHVFFTAMVAYSFSKKYLVGRKYYMIMGTITLFFSGGLIPYFLLIRNLGLLDNFLVYVIPTAFYFFDALIFISFFRTIPESIEESAKIDGANEFYIFLKLIIPLSTPVLATITLFNGVFNWNDYFMGVIFITRKMDLLPIQTFLYKMVATTEAYSKISAFAGDIVSPKITPQSVRAATMVLTTAPIICIYPFLQKYFTKGIMLGSVKG